MGCDIHAHIESYINEKPPWYHLSEVSINRNYRLFGRLAGVRDRSSKPISSPRGLPSDATVRTKDDAVKFGSDGHSHSWLTLAELESAKLGHIDVAFVSGVLGYMRYLSGELASSSRVRLVFWFDN